MFEEFMIADVGPEDYEEVDNVIPIQGKPVPETFEGTKKRAEVSQTLGLRKVSNFVELYEDDEKLTFILDGIMPDTGLVFVGGISGTGKTILAIQAMVNIVLGRNTMMWRLGNGAVNMRALMLSLEMGKKELQKRQHSMYPNLNDDEKKVLEENLVLYTEPEPFKLWDPVDVLDLVNLIKAHDINFLLIDSASVCFAENLNDIAQVNASLENLRRIRLRWNVAMMIVAHTRKPPSGMASNPEDTTLNELFGHSGVAQHASSIFIMVEDDKARKATIRSGDASRTEKMVWLINAKSRYGANSGAHKAHLTSEEAVSKGEPLMFRNNVIAIEMTPQAKRDAKKKSLAPSAFLADVDIDDLTLDGD